MHNGCDQNSWFGRLVGVPHQDPIRARDLDLPAGTTFGTGVELFCVEFRRGDYILLTDLCLEIQAGAIINGKLYLLAVPWRPARQTVSPLRMWQNEVAHQKPFLVPAETTKGCERARLVRQGSQYLSVLR